VCQDGIEEEQQDKESQEDVAVGSGGGELDPRPRGIEEHEHVYKQPLPQSHSLPSPRVHKPLIDLGHLEHRQSLEKDYPLPHRIHWEGEVVF